MRTWKLWAEEHEVGFCNFGDSKEFVELYGEEYPIVEVVLTENPDGRYWGWIDTGETSPVPCLIWWSEPQFKMQFPYGVEIEVERGEGIVVRFDVEKIG